MYSQLGIGRQVKWQSARLGSLDWLLRKLPHGPNVSQGDSQSAAGLQVHARAYLPNLEDKQGIHVDMIDTFGTRHRFRYCSWINNSSRMYLLEGVAPALVRLSPPCHSEVFASLPSAAICCVAPHRWEWPRTAISHAITDERFSAMHIARLSQKISTVSTLISTEPTANPTAFLDIQRSKASECLSGVLQNALKLKAGDILIFGKTKQGELLLGGRARTASDKDRKAPPRTRKSDGAPGDKPVVKSAPLSLWSLYCHCQHACAKHRTRFLMEGCFLLHSNLGLPLTCNDAVDLGMRCRQVALDTEAYGCAIRYQPGRTAGHA